MSKKKPDTVRETIIGEQETGEQHTRRQFMKIVTSTAISQSAFGTVPQKSSRSRPNIIFLLTDDQRWNTLGCTGNRIIQTPVLDGLASRGCLFKNSFVTTSICAPSRISILTGLYARCHGIHEFNTGLTGEALQSSYPLLLRRSGYRTGFIGKWGAAGGGVFSDDFSTLPVNSFDFFKGFPGQGFFFPDPKDPKRHLTRIMGDQALEFLDGCSGSQPFCLSVSFKAPHVQDIGLWPNDPAYDDLYKDVTIPPPDHGAEEYFEALPPFLKKDYAGRVRWVDNLKTLKYQDIVKKYYRLITGVDVQVGRILDALARKGFAQNTVVIFMSDNGYLFGDRGLIDKYIMYDDSIRIPLIIADPRNPEARNVVREEMALNIDIAPTILDLAGVKAPEWMNGRSLKPLLGKSKSLWRQEWFYEHLFEWGAVEAFPKSEGIRTTRWKYIRWIEQQPVYEQLFDLEKDPGELHNLAGSSAHQIELRSMRVKWDQWKQSLKGWNRAKSWHEPG
jgi:arylsulfatase A-like enzyme